MTHTHNLKQQRLVRWIAGLIIVVAFVTASTVFVAFDGFGLPGARPSVAAPAENHGSAPVPGPYELYHLYHMEGAPTAVGKPVAPEDSFQSPWERYHCSGCP
jgi:hypothetical protein